MPRSHPAVAPLVRIGRKRVAPRLAKASGLWAGLLLLSGLGLAAPTPGSVDTSFNPSELAGVVRALVIQKDGCALAGGEFLPLAGMSALFRVNTNGIVDQDYRVITELGTQVTAIALDADDNAFVAGDFTRVSGKLRDGLVRLDRYGEVDPGFSPVLDPTNAALIGPLLALPDGRLFSVGISTNLGGLTELRMVSLTALGALDAGFVPPVVTLTERNGRPLVSAMALAPRNHLVIAGYFDAVNGQPRRSSSFRLWRLP